MMRLLTLLCLATCCFAETFVLSVGVEQYDDGRISALKYAVADARSVAAAFRASGVRPENVTVLTSSEKTATRRPTRIALITNLQRIRDRARPGDKVVFFFAGHGIEEGGEQYLLTVDTRRDLVSDTALPLELANKALEGLQASELLCIVDACRNNPDAARGDEGAQLTEGLVRGVRPRVLPATQAQPQVLATLLSCDVGQRAYEDPDRGHGVFTVQVLAGLTGGAAGQDGLVRLKDLASYVMQEVALWAKRTGKSQTPRLVNPSGGDMVILKPADEPLVSIDARNSTLADVVADIADQVAAQVVFGEGANPEAKVSGHLELQPLTTALKVLLLAHKLTVRRQGAMYIIETPGATPEPATPTAPVVIPAPTPPTIHPTAREGVSYDGPKPTNWPSYLPWPIPGVSNPDLRFRVAEKDGMPQVLIPAGEFTMGTTPEQLQAALKLDAATAPEQHREMLRMKAEYARDEVTSRVFRLSAYWIDLHEVTVGQYRRYCQAFGTPVPADPHPGGAEDLHPVVNVRWEDSEAYAKWAGRELPTEAQWERAARAGTSTIFPWGDDWRDERANHSREGATLVGSYLPNQYGLFDVVGNVAEWCRDWYIDRYSYHARTDPCWLEPLGNRVIRGGAWDYGFSGVHTLRVADRQYLSSNAYPWLGFRCVSPAG